MAQEIYHRSNWGIASNEWGSTYLNADLTNELYKRAGYYENSWATDKILNKIGTKPSIILTPTAYEDGKLNSVKPKGGENLIPYSEDFSRWNIRNGATVTDNYVISPDGTQNAAKVVYSGASDGRIEYGTNASGTNTQSIYLKTDLGTQSVSIGNSGGDLKEVSVTNEWQRFTYTGYGSYPRVLCNDVATIYVWGAQLERGSKATEYIKTNGTAYKNGDFSFTRGSSATRVNEKGLVQDVQILSDELVQNGDFEQIGSELVTNGSFDTNSDWSLGVGWSIEDGKLVGNGAESNALQSGVVQNGNIYKITLTTYDITTGYVSVRVGSGGTENFQVNSNGTQTFYTTADNGTFILFRNQSGFDGSIDNVSVKEVGQNWTFGTGWSIEDGVVSADAPTGNLEQSLTATSGSKYRVTFTISNYVSGDIRWRFTGTSNENGTLRSANGTYTEEITLTNNQSVFIFPPTSGVMDIDNISLIEITDDTDLPRIDYTDGEGSLLLEPQSSNLVTYSEQISQYTVSGLTVIDNNITSPQGTTNASKITETNGGSIHYAGVSLSGVASNYAWSCFLKKGTVRYAGMRAVVNGFSNRFFVNVDLNDGSVVDTNTVGSGVNWGYSIEKYKNNWYRLTITAPNTAGNMDLSISPSNQSNPTYSLGLPSYSGNSNNYFYAWGVQFEALPYATSYIPTNGTTVTRLADVANNAGNADLINSTEGVLYVDYKIVNQVASFPSIQLADNSLQNQVTFYTYNNTLRYYVKSNNINVILSDVNVSENTDYKFAISYSSAETSIFLNGVKQGSFLTKNMPSNLEKLNIITSGNVSKYKCVAVFKEALSDEELHKLTSL